MSDEQSRSGGQSTGPARFAGVRGAAVVAVALLVVVGVIVAATRSDPSGHSGTVSPGRTSRPDVTLDVGSRPGGRLIAPGFVGMSFEFYAVRAYTGPDTQAVNPVLEQLIRNLAPGQSPVLRIGGDSTDSSWVPTKGVGKPPGVHFSITQGWLASAGALARALDARMILGVNLKADNLKLAAAEGSALVAAIGRSHTMALEIGNEPGLYGSFPWYHTPAGRPVAARPPNYSFSDFTRDFSAFARVLPRVPLAGPTAGSFSQLTHLGRFLGAEPRVGVATYHRYPLNRCFTKRGTPEYPTIPNLLAPFATTRLAQGLTRYVTLAHARGIQFRIDEMNSVACGGKRGISNTFASALWALDATFAMARAGVDGVNIHMFPAARYELFSFTRSGGRWVATVRPEYYGLLMFARAAPPGARLLGMRRLGDRHELRAWATRGPGGQTHVVLINDSRRRTQVVGVRMPGAGGAGAVERLKAPRLDATSGVTLAGQSFGGRTATGQLAGTLQSTPVTPNGRTYSVSVPPTSAATLTINPR